MPQDLAEKKDELELTSKLTEPFLLVSNASKRKCAYVLESVEEMAHLHKICYIWTNHRLLVHTE